MNTIEREFREQREQPSNHGGDECSHDDYMGGNTENISNPVLVPPLILLKPEIERSCYLSHVDWFELNGKKLKPGLYWHGKRHKDGDSVEVDEWICSPLTIEGITFSPIHDNFGRLLKLQDTNGRWHEWAMPMHLLKGNGDELRGELLNQGVTFNPKKRSDIINYIMTQPTYRKITAVDRVGWYDDAFVLPNQVIGKGDVVFQSEAVAESEFQTKGTLEGWQQEIGRLCVDNVPLMISIAAALAGPLLKFIDRQQGGGIHWVGDSSCGKSTAVEVAASVWGSSEFIRSWSATANGLEGVAATRNETCLILDEIDEASPHEIGKIAYMLANGQGKQRAGRVGTARKIQRWRIITISTGERTLTSIMNEIGKRPNAGQLVRLLSIPVTFEHGAFSNLHEFESGRSLSDHLKSMRLKHYGHVGPAFIRKLMDDKRDFPALLNTYLQPFNSDAKTNLEKRAAMVFAIIALAGELAIEYGILPWEQTYAWDAALIGFQRWQTYSGPGQTEDTQILQSISDFIAKHGDSRFSAHHERMEDTIYNRAGWYKDADIGRVYMFLPVALIEAGGGFERSRIVEALKRAKWIAECDAGRATKKARTRGGLNNLYFICEPGQTCSPLSV
jgi:putative DNA primase/helicase